MPKAHLEPHERTDTLTVYVVREYPHKGETGESPLFWFKANGRNAEAMVANIKRRGRDEADLVELNIPISSSESLADWLNAFFASNDLNGR